MWSSVLIGSPQGQDQSSVRLLLEFERESDFLVPPFTDKVSAYMRPDRVSWCEQGDQEQAHSDVNNCNTSSTPPYVPFPRTTR